MEEYSTSCETNLPEKSNTNFIFYFFLFLTISTTFSFAIQNTDSINWYMFYMYYIIRNDALNHCNNQYVICKTHIFKRIYELSINKTTLHVLITLDGVMGPAHALTAINGSLGLQDMGGTLTPHLELSGDQGVPMNGWEELSSDLSNGTKYWPGIEIILQCASRFSNWWK